MSGGVARLESEFKNKRKQNKTNKKNKQKKTNKRKLISVNEPPSARDLDNLR